MKSLRVGPLGISYQPRVAHVGLILGAAVAAVLLTALTTGKVDVGMVDALKAAVGLTAGSPADYIVGEVRAPRALTAILVGAMLGLAGAIMQSLTRNPLASPDFIGISAGAGAGTVAVLWIAPATSLWVAAAGAAGGALVVAVAMFALSWRGRGIVPLRLILTGIGLGFVAESVTQYLITRMDVHEAGNALGWLVGSTTGRSWKHVAVAATVLAVVGVVVGLCARALRVMEMGDDAATALGVRVARSRAVLAASSVLLTAGAVAVAGPIGFVALVAPALAVRVTRSVGVTLVPSALMGALLLLTADQLAQRLPATLQLPVGVFTAAAGAPYLLWLVWRASRGGQR